MRETVTRDRNCEDYESDTASSFSYDLSKRIIDVVLAGIGLGLLFPLWVVIAIAIRITSPGSPIFAITAVGKDGTLIRVYKFRTMVADNDDKHHREYTVDFVKENRPYAMIKDKDGTERGVYKILNDDRVTPFGRILRKTGLDEVPQFVNVLSGEMSLVGPRPPEPSEYELYEPWHKQRLKVIPGITGLYQVTARSEVPFEDMVRIDLDYIRKRSLWFDLKIMLLTVKVVIQGKGAY